MNPLGVIQRDNQTEDRIRDELKSRRSVYGSNQDRSLRRNSQRNSSSSRSPNNHRLAEQSRRRHRSRCNFPVSQYRQSNVPESDGENVRPSRDMRRTSCRHYSSSKENAWTSSDREVHLRSNANERAVLNRQMGIINVVDTSERDNLLLIGENVATDLHLLMTEDIDGNTIMITMLSLVNQSQENASGGNTEVT